MNPTSHALPEIEDALETLARSLEDPAKAHELSALVARMRALSARRRQMRDQFAADMANLDVEVEEVHEQLGALVGPAYRRGGVPAAAEASDPAHRPGEVRLSPRLKEILLAMPLSGAASLKSLAKAIEPIDNRDGRLRVRSLLHRLGELGLVRKTGRGTSELTEKGVDVRSGLLP